MAEWIVCPACGLKHSAREDGACPRCHAALAQPVGWPPPPPPLPLPQDPAAGAAGETPLADAMETTAPFGLPPPAATGWSPPPPPAAAPPPEPFPLGARLAGWILFANALVNIASLLKAGRSPADPRGPGLMISILFDALVGAWLVAGREKGRSIALVRVGLGALVLTPIAWSNGGALQGVLQLLFSLGLLLLLFGRPGPVRLAAGLVPAISVLVLPLALMLDGGLAGSLRGLQADLADRGHLESAESAPSIQPAWKLPLPGDRWHEEKVAVPNIDRAVTWPEEDAHVLLFVKPISPGMRVDPQKAAEAMLNGARSGERSLTEQERRPIATRRGQGLAVRCTTSKAGEETDGWYVTLVTDDTLAFVIAVAPATHPPEVGEALLSVASGLEL